MHRALDCDDTGQAGPEAAGGAASLFAACERVRFAGWRAVLGLGVVYAAFLALTQPGWLASGAIWAEAATNYWPTAHSASWLERLFAADAGYIPLPQRLLALVAGVLPAWAWAYAASLIGHGLAVLLAGVFTQARFRALVPSDAMRFALALAVLLAADFQTTSFINVIYFSALPLAALAALAFVERERPVPAWGWAVPVLCLSKPVVLVVLPAMVLAALVSERRFRWITVASVLVAIGQAARLVASHAAGTMAGSHVFTLAEQATGAVRLALVTLVDFTVPPAAMLPVPGKIVGGVLIAALLVRLMLRGERRVQALIGVGAVLIAGNFVILAFTLGDFWLDPARLSGFLVTRQDLVALFGAGFIVLGAAAALPAGRMLAVSGWAVTLLAASWGQGDRSPPARPVSHWQALAADLDRGTAPLCVPVDPAGWVYGRDCRSLDAGYQPGLQLDAAGLAPTRDVVLVRPQLQGKNVLALGLVAVPSGGKAADARAEAVLASGARVALAPAAALPGEGGMVLLRAPGAIAAADIQRVEVHFSVPVSLATYAVFLHGQPVVAWLGN